MTSDEDEGVEFEIRPVGELGKAIKSGNRRDALIGLRDFLVHELEGHRCSKCQMSQLRTGDTAALVLRLTKVLEDLEKIPIPNGEESNLDGIRNRARLSVVADRPEDKVPHGTKKAPRRQGGRKPIGTRKAEG